jgi:hypothetical protein
MADNDRHDTMTGGTELFYRGKNGRKQDAALHAEILGDDTMPWDLDLEAFAEMTPEDQQAYLKRLDDAMLGT